MSAIDLPRLAQDLRRHDRDRFAASMFAPAPARSDLWLLYALNQELGQIRTLVREPMAGMIRLQWWYEVADGQRDEEARNNPVAGPLLELAKRRQLPLTLVGQMIDARQRDLEARAFDSMADLSAYAWDGAGALTELAVLVLGADPRGARAAGAACAIIGLVRSLSFHLAQGWLTLPVEVVTRHGGSAEACLAGREAPPVLAAAVLELCDHAERLMAQARDARPERRALPALLPMTAAAAHLGRLRALGGDVFDTRAFAPRPMPLRLLWAALRGWP